MDNYEAIMLMDRDQFVNFLDDVYVTGVNTGMWAAGLPTQEEQVEALLEFPFDENWLASDAEEATLGTIMEDGEDYILDACAKAALRLAGIDASALDDEDEAY